MDPILLFAGAVVSVIVAIIRKYAGTSSTGTLVSVLGVSLVAAFGSAYLQHAGMWDSFLQIITAAGAVYAYFIKNTQDILAGKFN